MLHHDRNATQHYRLSHRGWQTLHLLGLTSVVLGTLFSVGAGIHWLLSLLPCCASLWA